jgi:hypothetical protein
MFLADKTPACSWLCGAIFSGAVLMWAVVYWCAFGSASLPLWDNPLKGVLAICLLTGLLWLAPPFLTTDFMDYLAWGRLLAIWKVDPFSVPSAVVVGDPWLHLSSWSNTVAVHGPLMVLMMGGIVKLAGGNMPGALIIFKGIMAMIHGLTGLTLYGAARTVAPRWAPTLALLYCLNPLVLVETINSLHDDALMLLFVTLSFWAWAKEKEWWALVALGVAILVKYVALMFLPLMVLVIWRRSQRRWFTLLTAGGCMILVTGVLFAWAFGGVQNMLGQFLGFQATGELSTTSLTWLLPALIGALGGPAEETRQIVSLITQAVFVLFSGWRIWQARQVKDVWREGIWIGLAYLLVGGAWIQPWYVTWILPAAALTTDPNARRSALLLSLGALVSHSPYLLFQSWSILTIMSQMAIMFGPLLVWWARRYRSRMSWATG